MARRVVLLTAALFAFAGCAAGESPASESAPTVPSASDDSGSIAVNVMSEDLVPVAQAQVLIVGANRTALSDENGRVTFNDMPPGNYTIVASHPAYTTLQEKGIVLTLQAGEIREVKFTLRPIEVVTAENSYYRTFPRDGFMACYIGIGLVGDFPECGQDDPNQKTEHQWTIENAQIQQVMEDMRWTPANAALAKKLRVWNYKFRAVCGATGGFCYSYTQGGVGGDSPVKWSKIEGADKNITEALPKGQTFPVSMNVTVFPVIEQIVPGYNVGYAIYYQQRYTIWMGLFYGQPAPEGFSVWEST